MNECSPAVVAGDIMAGAAIKTGDISDEVLESLGESGLASFAKSYHDGMAGLIDDVPFSAGQQDLKATQGFWKDNFTDKNGKNPILNMINEVAAPQAILGWDFIDQFDEKLNTLIQAGVTSGSEYKREVQRFFDTIDTSNFTDGQNAYYERYKAGYLYSLALPKDKSALMGKVDAITRGSVVGSPTVILGNYIEPFMKGIPLYGGDFFKGIQTLIKERGIEGLTEVIPDMHRQGLYGLDVGERETVGKMDGFLGALDRPARNVMYYVGLANEGTEAGGRRAVQRVLFTPSSANIPLAYRQPVARAGLRLLSYSLGTVQLFRDVIKEAVDSPSPKSLSQLAGLMGMYGVVTGIPAYMKSQGEDVADIPIIGPVWKAAASVSSISLPDRLGIPFSIFNDRVKAIKKVTTSVFSGEAPSAKEIALAASAMVFLSSGSGSTVEAAFSNSGGQRVIKNAIDTFTGDKEMGEAMVDTFLPSYNR